MNHRRRLVALSVNTLVLGLLLSGCSGDDDDSGTTATGGGGGMTGAGGGAATGGTTGTGGGAAVCGDVVPCGGDVTGTWTVKESCLTLGGDMDMTLFGIGCTSSSISGTLSVTGTLTFDAAGTYTDNTATSGSPQVVMPAKCLLVSGTTTICGNVNSPFSTAGFTEATCTDDTATGGCNCTATVTQATGFGVISTYTSSSGNYTVAGNVLTIDESEGIAYSYCVSGNTMTLVPTYTKNGTLTGSVVLQK
jgi:hypothetical protein